LTPIEIPVASPLGKLLVLGCSLLVAVAVLWWAAPKFTQFLKTVFDSSPSNPKMTPLHIAMGFLIYAIVFSCPSPLLPLGMATTPPTRITPTGVTGGTFACTGTRLVLSFPCSFQFSFIRKPPFRGMKSSVLSASSGKTAPSAPYLSTHERSTLKSEVLRAATWAGSATCSRRTCLRVPPDPAERDLARANNGQA
jgi:hypothetical protein